MKEPRYIKDNLKAGAVVAALLALGYGLKCLAEWMGWAWWAGF